MVKTQSPRSHSAQTPSPSAKKAPSSDDYELREECGVLGIYSFTKKDVAEMAYRGLINLQHRGQDSAGMATFNGTKLQLHRALGLVNAVFSPDDIERLAGHIAIAQVRYPTIGAGGPEDAQPFMLNYPFRGVALAHNGNIANYGIVRSKLEEAGHQLTSTCDADLILAVFVHHLKEAGLDISEAVLRTMKELDGSYSVCAVTGRGELVVFRDPKAIRPLVWGKTDDYIMFASESVALDINDIPLAGEVGPGECLIIDPTGVKKKSILPLGRAHCMFEYVYFSRPDSIQQGKLVHSVRQELGRRLARHSPVEADIVVPVPDTSRPAAEGYSQVSGLPLVEGLIKNRYIGRTFIMPTQSKRADAVKLKLNAVRPLLEGKRVVLIDDSIVRGTTSGPIVKLVRDAGAKEVHLRIACPPTVSPCFYGVDLPNFKDLVAAHHSVEEIRKIVGADSLEFLSLDDLFGAIGIESQNLCYGCVGGKYPTELGNKIVKLMKEKGDEGSIRIWEEKVL